MLSEWESESAYAMLGQGAKHKGLMVCISCAFRMIGRTAADTGTA